MPLLGRFRYTQTHPTAPPRPVYLVKLFIGGTDEYISVPCIIDTGADSCIFPSQFSSALGHSLRSGLRSQPMNGIGGSLTGHLHTNDVEIAGVRYNIQCFMCENWQFGYGLLGHTGFLDRFDVFLSTRHQYYEIYS